MKTKTIYVLHKNGAPSHYTGLEQLLKTHNLNLKHREFSVFSKLFKSIFKLRGKEFVKQLVNFCFLISLLFSKNKKIVLGIAPFDHKLSFLLFFLKKHKAYYHSSWICWDKTFHPKTKKNSAKVFEKWRYFLEEKTTHIFVVTQLAQNEILKNYNINKSKTSVVYHSLDLSFSEKPVSEKEPNSYISVGRIIPEKGIKEMLEVFSQRPHLKLTIVGGGSEEYLVQQYAQKFDNIIFSGKISNRKKLFETMQMHQYLVLNSKKTAKWEELFGLVVIEGMSQGLIVLSSNHAGPREIITPQTGRLFEEGTLSETVDNLSKLTFSNEMAENAIENSKKYLPQNIALLWTPILK